LIDSPPKRFDRKQGHKQIVPKKKTRKATWLFVPFSFIDILSEYPTKRHKGNSDKLSNCKDSLSTVAQLSRKINERLRKSLYFGRKLYFCRGPPDCRCSRFRSNYDNHRRKIMFDKHSDFALNKLDPDAIVCKSATGVHIRLTREDFSSEEEFLYWKKKSDSDYKDIETAGRGYYDNCIPLAEGLRTAAASAEDAFFAPILKAERKEQRIALIRQFKRVLTKKQYRRLWLYFVECLSMEQIAQQEGGTHQTVSECIAAAKDKIVNNL